MKILMTADAVGGVWTYALELARSVRAFGVELVIATMGPRPTTQQQKVAAALENVSLFLSDYRLEWMQEPWQDVDAAGEWLLELEQHCTPDIVHVNGYTHAALPFTAPTVLVAHSCVFSWWQAVHGTLPPPAWAEYKRRVSHGLDLAKLVVAPSAAMLDALRRSYGFDRPARVIPNARNAAAFSPGVKQARIMAVGRVWDEAKNLHTLMAAAQQLSWPVHIAGVDTAPDGTRITSLDVVMLGALDEPTLATALGRAAIFVHPAVYEPFGLAVVEAGLSGCALVLSDIPSLRENWDGDALFVPNSNETALVEAIEQLIGRPHQRLLLAGRAYDRARTFAPEWMARAYMVEYERLALSPTPGVACAS